jgi:hypothetical protein
MLLQLPWNNEKKFIIEMPKYVCLLFLVWFMLPESGCDRNRNDGQQQMCQGLIGAWYHGSDLTRIGSPMRINDLDIKWDVISGRGNGWSARWEGYIVSPVTGEVTFYGESDRELILNFDGREIIHVGEKEDIDSATVRLRKGANYPVNVVYLQNKGGTPYMRISWRWDRKEKAPVSPEAICFNEKQAGWWNYQEPALQGGKDPSEINTVSAENRIVFYETGRFAGWPANNGVWSWGNEILVGFELGYHDPDISGGHAIREDRPSKSVLARSLDGGKTWDLEEPSNYIDSPNDAPEYYRTSPGINFEHPGFAMRIRGNRYFVSYDRGKSWDGPFKMEIDPSEEEIGQLTSRTDYLVLGPDQCLVFLSAETGVVEADYQDRSFCAMTADGGRSFHFVEWMTADTDKRSVMSSTVKLGEDHLVTVMRRKHEERFGERPSLVRNWIEAAESKDSGRSWSSLGKVAETDHGERNGNPPALVRLPDGRLVAAYGYRGRPYGIRMKVSEDGGKSWGEELVVRKDGANWDMGYPRMVLIGEGKLVIIYYFTTNDRYEQHIEASIIELDDLRNS